MENKKIAKGNVCVDDKGQLFIAFQIYRLPTAGGGPPNTWQGMGFHGQMMHAERCSFVANNLNEYLLETYGNNYSKEVAAATNATAV